MGKTILALIFSIYLFLSICHSTWADQEEWIEVPKTDAGQQWWKKDTIEDENNGIRRILTRFRPALDEDGNKHKEELYLTELNCKNKLYRDIKVNGISQPWAKWQYSKNDQLIMSMIDSVCSETLTS